MDFHVGLQRFVREGEFAAAHFEDVVEEAGAHAAGEDGCMDGAGLLEDEGCEGGAGGVAEEDYFGGAELGDGGGVGADLLLEIAFGAVAGGAFAIADSGLFDAEGGVAGAGEGVEELDFGGGGGGGLLGGATGAGEPEDDRGIGFVIGNSFEGTAAVVVDGKLAVLDGEIGLGFRGRREEGEGEGEGLGGAADGEGEF